MIFYDHKFSTSMKSRPRSPWAVTKVFAVRRMQLVLPDFGSFNRAVGRWVVSTRSCMTLATHIPEVAVL
jgi:hypothetical protein